MSQQNKSINWEEVQDSELKKWYHVSKIMGQILSGDFPYFTFEELWRQITNDPEYKKKDEE
jgi:hypothetical protein